jgi:hypothetical protein
MVFSMQTEHWRAVDIIVLTGSGVWQGLDVPVLLDVNPVDSAVLSHQQHVYTVRPRV